MSDEFKKMVLGIKRVKSETSKDFYKISKNKSVKKQSQQNELFEQAPVSYENFSIQGDDYLEFKSEGVQNSIFKKLSKGQIPVEANIDLHAMTILEAEMYLYDALLSIDTGFMVCVRVIHGKGYHTDKQVYENVYPKLKNFTYRYLKQHPRTLAFVSCPNNRGGTGSLFVLLKGEPCN